MKPLVQSETDRVFATQTCKLCPSYINGNEFADLDDDILKSLEFLQINLVCTYISNISSFGAVFFEYRWSKKGHRHLAVSCIPLRSKTFYFSDFHK